jgi:MFS family permease
LTRGFIRITAAALSYFVGIGMQIPVIPLSVEEELGGGGVAVGIGVGAFAVSAAVLRPVVGRIGDQRGRRVLVVGGTLVAAASVLGNELAVNLPLLVLMRLATGVGEAAVFVGAATAVQDLAPPPRRGEAASYFSVAVYGGLGVGPVLGELVRDRWSTSAAWLVAAGFCLVAAAIATGMPTDRPQAGPPHRRWLHPAAVRPGLVLALSTMGFAGFSTFLPLYVDEVGLDGSGAVFASYAFLVLVVRIFGARLPDRLGAVRGASGALAVQALGLVAMGLWASEVGLFVSTLVYAMGVSLMYPSLLPLVVRCAPDAERSQAVGTFTLFFDVAQGLGAFALGGLVSLSGSEQPVFVVAGLLSVAGVAVLRSGRYEERD